MNYYALHLLFVQSKSINFVDNSFTPYGGRALQGLSSDWKSDKRSDDAIH